MTKTWGIIKEILGMQNHNSQPSISKLITQTDDAVTDKGKISNELNVFFTNIGPSLTAKIPAVTKAYLNNNSIRSQTNSIFFYPATPKEVEKQFESLNAFKASGPGNIAIKYIKIVGKIISPMLSEVFNQLIGGVFPKILKIAKVIPIHKRGSVFSPTFTLVKTIRKIDIC